MCGRQCIEKGLRVRWLPDPVQKLVGLDRWKTWNERRRHHARRGYRFYSLLRFGDRGALTLREEPSAHFSRPALEDIFAHQDLRIALWYLKTRRGVGT
jgi:hypothetical protein